MPPRQKTIDIHCLLTYLSAFSFHTVNLCKRSVRWAFWGKIISVFVVVSVQKPKIQYIQEELLVPRLVGDVKVFISSCKTFFNTLSLDTTKCLTYFLLHKFQCSQQSMYAFSAEPYSHLLNTNQGRINSQGWVKVKTKGWRVCRQGW